MLTVRWRAEEEVRRRADTYLVGDNGKQQNKVGGRRVGGEIKKQRVITAIIHIMQNQTENKQEQTLTTQEDGLHTLSKPS